MTNPVLEQARINHTRHNLCQALGLNLVNVRKMMDNL